MLVHFLDKRLDALHFLFLAAETETYQKDLLLKGDWDHPVVTG